MTDNEAKRNEAEGKPNPNVPQIGQGLGSPTGITGHTKLVTLLGKPAFHSKSPETNTLAWRKLGIDAVFLAFEVDEDGLDDAMKGFKACDGWIGITVTMPLKQAMVPYMDRLSDVARIAQAVNIVVKEPDGSLSGYNSDGPGFMNNLYRRGFKPEGAVMTLVGPGGAGRAVMVQAALDGVGRINAFAREGGKSYNEATSMAQALAAETGCQIDVLPYEDKALLRESIQQSDVLVNGTNVGMGEGNTESPVTPDLIRPGMMVADIVNTPRYTQMLKDAQKLGCTVVSGLEMIDQQAVVADRFRYGVDIPIGEVRAELDEFHAQNG